MNTAAIRTAARMARFSIVRIAAPGSAADRSPGVEWVAAKQSPGREPDAAQNAVLLEREPGVLRAGRREPAGARQKRRNQPLIGHDRAERDPRPGRHGRGPGMAASAPRSSVASAANGSALRGWSSDDPQRGVRRGRVAGRPIGLAQPATSRLRCTAPQICRLTAKPARRGSVVARQSTITEGRSIRLPR